MHGLLNVLGVTVESDQVIRAAPDTPDMVTSRYCYYADRDRFRQGTVEFTMAANLVDESVSKHLGPAVHLQKKVFPEDPDLLYTMVLDRDTRHLLGIVYLRNSGTEPKTGVHVRAWQTHAEAWHSIAEELHVYLMTALKSPTDPFVEAEYTILNALKQEPHATAQLISMIHDLPGERIL